MFAGIHQVTELWPTRAELISHALPDFPRMFTVVLLERLSDRGGDDSVLATRYMGQGVAHPMNAAALPCCLEDTRDCPFQASMCVADHQLHAIKATGFQAAQKVHPEGLGFRWSVSIGTQN